MAKKKKQYKKSSVEDLLCSLHDLIKNGSEDRRDARSLLNWYLRKKKWTPKQFHYVKIIVARNKKADRPKPVKYSLYAISNGESVKLGISTDIHKRLKELQTANSASLEVIWKHYIGREKKAAYDAERKLHRLCRKYKLRGEWFKDGCMHLVNQFSLKDKIMMDNEQRDHDSSMIDSCPF